MTLATPAAPAANARHDARRSSTDHASPVPASDFQSFSTQLRTDLAPATLLEDVLVDRVVLAAWRLQLLSRHDTRSIENGASIPAITRSALRAESSLETALSLLDAARDSRNADAGRVAEQVSTHAGFEADLDVDLSNEWPVVPGARDDEGEAAFDEDDSDAVHRLWRDRLTLDPTVAESSPVVKGTWVTVSQVVSLVVDGWSWSDILRSHPELSESDIRACLAYTAAQDSQGEV